jgi:hypothetical protein
MALPRLLPMIRAKTLGGNQRMWDIQFYSEQGREAFMDKMAAFRETEKGTVIDPAYLTAVHKAHARETSLSR